MKNPLEVQQAKIHMVYLRSKNPSNTETNWCIYSDTK